MPAKAWRNQQSRVMWNDPEPDSTERVRNCPAALDDGTRCGVALEFTDEMASCRGCGASWPRSRWLDLGDQALSWS